MPRFPKPTFKALVDQYLVASSSVHSCRLIDPTKDTVNTCAARMSEALVLANHLAGSRQHISHPLMPVFAAVSDSCALSAKIIFDPFKRVSALVNCVHQIGALAEAERQLVRGDGKQLLLGQFNYTNKLCPHGIARGAQDLARFLKQHWGVRTRGWAKPQTAPAEINDEQGILAFLTIPGFSGQGHIDLWNKGSAVGSAYWDAETVWFWKLD